MSNNQEDQFKSFISNLTLAERERLQHLIEEWAEVIKEASKTLRHGWDAYDPSKPGSPTNKEALEKELRDVVSASTRLRDIDNVEFNPTEIIEDLPWWWSKKKKYFNYQD